MSSMNPQEIAQEVLKYTFDITDNVKLHVSISEAVGNKARNYMETLKVERHIPNLDDIDNTFEGVVTLARALHNQQEGVYNPKGENKLPAWITEPAKKAPKKNAQELLAESVRRWKEHVGALLNVMQVEALILAIVNEGELEVDGEKVGHNFFNFEFVQGIRVYGVHSAIPIPPHGISPDYFDVSKINAERAAELMPAVPQKNPVIAQEQMLAWVDAVKKQNSDFAVALATFFENYANSIVEKSFNIAEEVAKLEYDNDGFHDESMDGHTSPTDVNQDPPKQRKPRTTRAEVLALREGNS